MADDQGLQFRDEVLSIDGTLRWVEHSAPYFYGSDGNYLVTSFLAPGVHTFATRAIWTGGRTATNTVRAQVGAAPAPPPALAGTWRRFQGQMDPSSPPPGYWRLVINSVGWAIYDTSGGGNLLDVAYLSPGLLEIRQGMMTSPASQLDGNGWCNNEPGPTVRLRYAVQGNTLMFTPIGPPRLRRHRLCDRQPLARQLDTGRQMSQALDVWRLRREKRMRITVQ